MKKFAITSTLSFLALVLIFSSCTPHRKTLGCPGMITKAKVHSTTVQS